MHGYVIITYKEVFLMAERIRSIVDMVFRGARGISLYKKRDYNKYAMENTGSAAADRWYVIGTRLRDAMNKVVNEYGTAR